MATTVALTLVMTALSLSASGSAWAYFTGSGHGSGRAVIATLIPPGQVTAIATEGTVTVTWSAATTPDGPPDGYWVTRTPMGGGDPVDVCGEPDQLLDSDTTTCNDSAVAQGDYTYAVMARFRTWTTMTTDRDSLTVAPWSTTTLNVDQSELVYGAEDAATFTAQVSTSDGSPPTGSIAVTSGMATVCTITLPGTSCTADFPTALDAGPDPQSVTAVYTGDSDHPGSTSPPVEITVAPDSTTASIQPSQPAVTYGYEQTIALTATVATHFGETLPSGDETTTIQAGSSGCQVTIGPVDGGGSGFCRIQYADLAASATPYVVTMTYPGDNDLTPSGAATATLLVNPPPSISTTTLPSGTKGQAYSTSLTQGGGTGPFTWTVSSGSLPQGLSLDSTTGLVHGTPNSSATRSFVIKVTDSCGASSTKSLSITIS